MLRSSKGDLCDDHDVAMLDLDGVVYVGPAEVPGAAVELDLVRQRGMRLAFVTNNAARPPDDVARHLRALGVQASAADVVTSAQAAAGLVGRLVAPGSRVLAVGGPGVTEALEAAGLVAVHDADDGPAAVVTGYGPELTWRQIMRAAVLIRGGLPWVACNGDLTIPPEYGLGPGHGALVELISSFAGVEPVIAGKPQRPLLDETIRRMEAQRPLMVGDRLDTDIEAAQAIGVPSLLVMTGVTGLAELVAAGPASRPSYISSTLSGLTSTHGAPERQGEVWQLAGWQARVVDGALGVEGQGPVDDWWRVVASAAWSTLDATGVVVDIGALQRDLPNLSPGER